MASGVRGAPRLEQVSIARSSLAQVETLLALALHIASVAHDDVVALIDQCAEVGRQIDALRQFLEEQS